MPNSLKKLKLLKLTMFVASVGGIVAVAVACVVKKELCKKKKKISD